MNVVYRVIVLSSLLTLGVAACVAVSPGPDPTISAGATTQPSSPSSKYTVINRFPHDPKAFTEGLVFQDGVLFESTGRLGQSSLRRVDRDTGAVIQIHDLPAQLFGEGITIWQNRVIQLTWRTQVGFIFDTDTFQLLGQFEYPGEGWGLTHDDTRLIMSDGTTTLRFLDPITFKGAGVLDVHDSQRPVIGLNELEYINGQIYANVWPTDRVAVISPESGAVTRWIGLDGLFSPKQLSDPEAALNGIAYDPLKHHLLVTGKLWPWLFELEENPPR
jgi:glutamine cyclotransferase